MTSAAVITELPSMAARLGRPRRPGCAIWCNWRRQDLESLGMRDDAFSLRLYRRLLKFYPAAFRESYTEAMERAFRDELRESSGIGLWIRLIADLAASVPPQLAREIAQDARHTLRLWAVRPWNTAFAILALAIGIGANTGVFSIVDALLLRSLPFRDAARLASFPVFLLVPHTV